jgi:hypothetical protein
MMLWTSSDQITLRVETQLKEKDRRDLLIISMVIFIHELSIYNMRFTTYWVSALMMLKPKR